MKNYFESPFKGKPLIEQVKNPNIKVGRYSYYSGYYHGHSFDDCARFLLPDRDDVDKLIIKWDIYRALRFIRVIF